MKDLCCHKCETLTLESEYVNPPLKTAGQVEEVEVESDRLLSGKDGEVKWVSSEPPARSSRGTACGGCKSGRTTCCDLLPSALATRLSKMRKWMWEDLTKSHLIWIKLIFFFQSASLVVLYPYLVIHMRSLGLSTEEVAVVSSIMMNFLHFMEIQSSEMIDSR